MPSLVPILPQGEHGTPELAGDGKQQGCGGSAAWGTEGDEKQPRTSPNSLFHPQLPACAVTPLPASGSGTHQDCPSPSIPCPTSARGQLGAPAGFPKQPSIQPRLEESPAAQGAWLWGRRGSTAPAAALATPAPSLRAEAPGEELCFRLCFTEIHLLMFD